MPSYPRWARAVTSPVSCYRVVQVEARAPFDRGRLVVQRRAPKVPEGFSSGSQGRSMGPDGSMPPYGGIPFGDLPASLKHDLGLYMDCPQSSLTLLVLGRLSKPLGGPTFEPLDRSGLGAQFLCLKGIGWGIFPPPIGSTIVGAPFEVIFSGMRNGAYHYSG